MAHIEGRQSVVDRPDADFGAVEDAVAWARERAPVVFVRLLGEDFRRSGGARPSAREPELPPWPPE